MLFTVCNIVLRLNSCIFVSAHCLFVHILHLEASTAHRCWYEYAQNNSGEKNWVMSTQRTDDRNWNRKKQLKA